MRPRVLRRRLILAGLGGMIAAATITTGVAKADPVDDYTITNAPTVCAVLDQSPTVAGVEHLGVALMDKGLSPEVAAKVVARSVLGWCPNHVPELQAFIDKWGTAGPLRRAI